MRISHIVSTAALLALGLGCSASSDTPVAPGGPTQPSGPSGPVDALLIAKSSGDTQAATLGTALGAPLVVSVTNGAGAPAVGVTVHWSVSSGNGSLDAESSTTDANGRAHVTWTLDNTYMGTSATAKVGDSTVTFTALGNGSGDLGGASIFPSGNAWRTDISGAAVDANSANLIGSCGPTASLHPDFGTTYDGAPNGIPYVVVHGTQATVPVSFDYADESDAGPYPVPSYAPIEGGPNGDGDRHVLVVDPDNQKLYELYDAHPASGGTSWTGGSGAIFDMATGALRPAGWTSADAAGLPIMPGLVRYDEVMIHQAINHALRFTCAHSRKAYVPPARHWASSSTNINLAPMGMRVRLKAGVDISAYPAADQVILKALKKYGMFMADNGSNMYLSGAPDPRWSDDDLHQLTSIHGSDFEVVQMTGLVTP